MANRTESSPTYGVRYVSDRRPHATKVEARGSLVEAQATFALLAAEERVGELVLIAPDETVVEYHVTNTGLVLVLVKEESELGVMWRTDVWTADDAYFYAETVSLHSSKRLATSQLMSVHAGLCAAQRAATAVKHQQRKAA